jgi:SAM-dependent methyltransferase
MNRALMNLWYRFGTPPWVLGPREELMSFVQARALRPGRALDLGCGEGDNAIFLAQRGFEVTGIDFAPAALAKARAKAERAGVAVRFVEGDLADPAGLRGIEGPFDVLVDFGTFDDLDARQRARCLDNVLPLLRPGGRVFMFCFEWQPRWWERLVGALVGAAGMVRPGEIEERFAGRFRLDCVERKRTDRTLIPATAVYLMTARENAR